jgi:rare lipoprotein A
MTRTKVLLSFCLLLFVLVISCSTTKEPETPAGGPSTTAQEKQVYIGLASFYAANLNGQETASGTPYDPTAYTAANRDLPLGTKVMVTNLENNRSVVVTITDRGPTRADRILDLSLAAATELNMLTSGVAKVRIEVVNE